MLPGGAAHHRGSLGRFATWEPRCAPCATPARTMARKCSRVEHAGGPDISSLRHGLSRDRGEAGA